MIDRPPLLWAEFCACWARTPLSTRAVRCLFAHDLRTSDEVRAFGERNLRRHRGTGTITINEICRAFGMRDTGLADMGPSVGLRAELIAAHVRAHRDDMTGDDVAAYSALVGQMRREARFA